MDTLDADMLRHLQADGRTSNAELARRLNLSPPAIHARLRRLEEEGYIRGYTAVLDRERLGFDMLCFVHITLQQHNTDLVERFRAAVREIPEVLECHHITGEYDYLLKAVVCNRKDLERLVVQRLTPIPGVARIHTSIALSEIKQTTALPLDRP
jgi:DNA-binding Lrp family transcriptional regulator